VTERADRPRITMHLGNLRGYLEKGHPI